MKRQRSVRPSPWPSGHPRPHSKAVQVVVRKVPVQNERREPDRARVVVRLGRCVDARVSILFFKSYILTLHLPETGYSGSSSKRQQQMAIISSPMSSSFAVLGMPIAHQQQQVPSQQLQTSSRAVHPQTDQEVSSGAMSAILQDYFSSTNNKTTSTGTNQLCNVNSMDVLPLDSIRMQIPTAAELACSAFSSDDEKSGHDSFSSRGSNQSNGLLPNK